MSSVRTDFPKDSRIRVKSISGWSQLPNVGSIATVVGYSRDGECVRILIDGQKTPQSFHKNFLEVWDE